MKPCSILIVEDHPFQHLYLQNLFSELGDFDLACARDGEEALDCLKHRDFDLVLTDLLMPGMDGVQFIQGLAAQRSRPALAIMSAASRRMLMGASLVASNLQVKVIGLISKPVNAAALRCLIDQLQALRQSVPAATHPGIDRQSICNALDNGELQAWFQPKKALNNGRIVAAEALIRWNHPEHGTLLPGVFLPALIAFGLEEPLLWCVLKQAIAAQATWREQGYDIPVSVNLPTHLLNSHDLPDRILAFVLAHQGLPARICFELMECSVPDDISNFYAGACRLRIKGFGLSQDDFGKGYSSYMNLVSAPFTELKIDRALVQGCHANAELAQALTSIVSLGRQLGLTVVAEGVETAQELALLRKIDCTQVQGFLISHAVSADQFQQLLTHDGPANAW
ncbi:diguanylate phosphodiesterase [Pseudomonas sp. MYb2]|jgi:EAL domain-containing protein (putative c-di-GMP-specific phosphodiesterase class I)/ActR/RegA family two-component response regulator|uniref:Sensor histidine kinase RcsC n=1 Tax=Pseudomonas fluorescens TaxID=294 RepID=A0A5E7I8Q9_PSEFL|nr:MULTISPECIES: EAL domain-containing response regulator [Pseudomonas]KPG97833.1 diguanylate phosphodiesterase [Pseudomonas sp. RIT-PI-r]MCP1489019.1 EAL domain-containing protein (putative c-di-GMP-specific phosphodiesterase class I) [Pseudomonas fluorescens]PRB49991.1 diguanylate phosphodiesterase [Pseudomonas sp. MYb3]PRC36629.1 diguanylate phosphodiesterase [Pseudomonas sp. MYb2]VVO72042.1 Sensor histidine kinase RcsC [Pseudomonas fluorescens]